MLKALGSAGDMFDASRLLAPLSGVNHIGVAVSGGADSLALMLMVARWAVAQTPAVTVSVYSVDHGLRPEAAKEALAVTEIAQRLGLEAQVLTWMGTKPQTGIQAVARAARYRLMGTAMAEDGAEVLLTAHHARDQAETVLMRMAHGSGLGGLGGMKVFSEVEGVRVFRPLLAVMPEDLAAVVREAGLEPVVDPSNDDVTYERVRWRQLSPAIDALGLDAQRVALFAGRASRADDALGVLTTRALENMAAVDDFGVVTIDRAALAAQPLEIQIRSIQQTLREVGAHQRPFALAPLEELAASLSGANFAKQTLLGCVVDRNAQKIVITREVARIHDVKSELGASQSICWDNRFLVHNNGEKPVFIRSGADMTRRTFEAAIGQKPRGNMAGVHAAPVVYNSEGQVLAVGSLILDRSIRVLSTVGSWSLTQP